MPAARPDAAASGPRNRPRSSTPQSTLFQQCVWLRLFHAGIREDLGGDATAAAGNTSRNAPPSVPLNQEDLLATLLSFSVTALRVLEAFGIAVDDADREAYVFLWNLVGACLGVGTPAVGTALAFLADWNGDHAPRCARPDGLAAPGHGPERRAAPRPVAGAPVDHGAEHDQRRAPVPLDRPRARPDARHRAAGRARRRDAAEPAGVAGDRHARAGPARPCSLALGLQRMGMTGLAGSALNGTRGGKRIRSSALRLMANDVTRHAMQQFLQADGPSPFRIPGLDLTQLTPVRRGSPYELRTRADAAPARRCTTR